MPRKAREPAPLPTLRQSGSLEAAMEAFRTDVHTAAEMYVDEKEQGKRAAIEAGIRLLFDLQPEAAIWRRPFVAIARIWTTQAGVGGPGASGKLRPSAL